MNLLAEGTIVTVVGIVIVFAVLVILMIVATLFKYIFKNAENKSAKNENTASKPVTDAVQPAPKAEFKPGFDTEDGELVAVIASSIAAYLNTSSGDIKIRSIRKVN